MEKIKRILIIIIVISFFMFLMSIQGCKTVEKIEYRTVYDTCYVSKEIKDSIYIRDSVYVYSKSDTVYYIKWKERIKYLVKTDTIFKTSTDTLIQNKEIIKEIEKKRPIRNIFALIGVIFIAVTIGYVVYKIKR